MCLSDIRLSRLVRAVGQQQTILLATPFVLPANPSRVGLTVSLVVPSTAANIGLVVGFTGGGSFLLAVNLPFFTWSVENNGDLPTKECTLTSTIASANVHIVEYILPPDVLNAAIEQFRSPYQGR